MMRILRLAAFAIICFSVFGMTAASAVDITITIVNPGAGVPSSVTLSPSSVRSPDTATSGTVLSVASVGMSDGSTFAGTLVSSNPGLVGVSGLNIMLARHLSASDDGFYNITIAAQP
jgi:hypothetical protein